MNTSHAALVLALGLALQGCTATPSAVASDAITKDALSTAPKGSWFPIDTRDMKGDLLAFDVQANYAWLDGWAKAWASDARMWRMSADHMPADGRSLNLQIDDKAEFDIRFISPTMVTAAAKLAETSEVELPTSFRISWMDGRFEAMIGNPVGIVPKEAPPKALGCSLEKVMAVAKASGKMEKKPYYDPWMRVWRGKWAWSVGDVFVNAETCNVM